MRMLILGRPASGSTVCGGKTVCPPEMIEARCKVGDLDGAMAVAHRGCDDRSVAEVLELVSTKSSSTTSAKTLLLGPCQQSAEHRIAVEAREAPHTIRCRIDESNSTAIADYGEVESKSVTGDPLRRLRRTIGNHFRTSLGCAKQPRDRKWGRPRKTRRRRILAVPQMPIHR